MLGLLVVACAAARRGLIAAAVVLCAAAASVKLPALIGVLFIGWCWAGPAAGLRTRVARTAAVLAGAAAVVAVTAGVCGLGWRFVGGLSNPGVVVSWLDPATAVGLGVANALHTLGVAVSRSATVTVVRGIALAAAALWSVRLFVRARPGDEEAAVGWSLLAFAVLGPVVWPWYETWGFVFLALTLGVAPPAPAALSDPRRPAPDWTVRAVVVLSTLACFADVPSAHEWRGASPALVGADVRRWRRPWWPWASGSATPSGVRRGCRLGPQHPVQGGDARETLECHGREGLEGEGTCSRFGHGLGSDHSGGLGRGRRDAPPG